SLGAIDDRQHKRNVCSGISCCRYGLHRRAAGCRDIFKNDNVFPFKIIDALYAFLCSMIFHDLANEKARNWSPAGTEHDHCRYDRDGAKFKTANVIDFQVLNAVENQFCKQRHPLRIEHGGFKVQVKRTLPARCEDESSSREGEPQEVVERLYPDIETVRG